MKKFSFFIGSMGKGGAERVISILANYYVTLGYEVDVIVLLANNVEYKLDKKVNIIDFSSNKNRTIATLYWLRKIRNYVKKETPYKIISFVGRINLLVLCACLGLNVEIYCSERNDPLHDGRNKLLVKLIELFYLTKNCKKIIFQTKYIQNCFSKYIKDKSIIIYNPVEVNINRKQPVNKIVTAGRLVEQKNQILLIEAFEDIIIKYPDYKLYIYGEGPLRGHLSKRIRELHLENKVFLPGNVDNIHEIISDAKIFVLTSKFEGLSNALLEAMVMGIPCISTKVSGIEEIIVNTKNGLLVNNKQDLVEAIEVLINDQEKCDSVTYNAKKLKKLFSLQEIIKKWNFTMGI